MSAEIVCIFDKGDMVGQKIRVLSLWYDLVLIKRGYADERK